MRQAMNSKGMALLSQDAQSNGEAWLRIAKEVPSSEYQCVGMEQPSYGAPGGQGGERVLEPLSHRRAVQILPPLMIARLVEPTKRPGVCRKHAIHGHNW